MSTMMTYVYARTESAESAFRGVHGDMEAANRSEAERCLRLAREARARGEAEKARKLAQKSLRLSSTQRAQGEAINCVNVLHIAVSATC